MKQREPWWLLPALGGVSLGMFFLGYSVFDTAEDPWGALGLVPIAIGAYLLGDLLVRLNNRAPK